MKIKTCLREATLLLAVLGIPLAASHAADHIDGPQAVGDPAADVNDIYAWMQDSNRINFALTVFPAATTESRFSDAVQYVIRVQSMRSYGESLDEQLLVCTFTPEQLVTCRLDGDELVTNVNASDPAGVTSDSADFRIFTGLRNDPFFFSSGNFNTARRAVRDVAPSLTFDEAGCPTVDQATKDALVGTITGNGGLPGATNPPVDFFEPLNTLAIVIQADRRLFGNGPVYAVSASTHRR